MPAIKIVDSKDITIEDCKFSGFDTAIELEDVSGFTARNNEFLDEKNPKALFQILFQEINNSSLEKSAKQVLWEEVVKALSSKDNLGKQEEVKSKIKYLGNKAFDAFIQLV